MHPHPLPMDPHAVLLKRVAGESECDVGIDTYRSAVGSLQYLVNTRPDLAFAVGVVARHVSAPSQVHWDAVRTIFRYVRGTQEYGLYYPARSSTVLSAMCDADWAGDRDDRRSTSGYACFLGDSLISFASKKQTSVALSTCEAEYVAAGACVQELLWLRQLLLGLRVAQHSTDLRIDNTSAIAFTHNPITNPKSKHIDIRHHFIRSSVSDGSIAPRYVPSAENTADLFTKALPKPAFFKHRAAAGVRLPVLG